MDLEGPPEPPALQFEPVGNAIALSTYWRTWNVKIDYNHVKGAIIAIDGKTILSINPVDGTHRILYQAADLEDADILFVSCVHPETGDVVLGVEREHRLAVEFRSLNVDTGQVLPISLHGSDLWEYEPKRLIYVPGGEQCIFAADDPGILPEIGHFSSSGEYLDWKFPDIDPDHSPINRYGIFDSDSTCIRAYFFDQRASTVLAGSTTAPGCCDGVGSHARFSKLRNPVVNNRYLFVRAEGAEGFWQWRLARLDFKTLQVQTVRIIGLDHNEIIQYCASDDDVFAIRPCSSSRDGNKIQLLRASLRPAGEIPAPTFAKAVASVDLSAPLKPVTFVLAGDVRLNVDRRLLVARSEYFKRMLSSGLQEDRSSVINLASDADADEASLSVLIRFVLSDMWEGPRSDAELAFRVRALADRYQLPKLLHLAEAHLLRLLGPATVLTFLGRVSGSGCSLEAACWSLLDAQGSSIIDEHEADLDAIIAQNPQLAKRMIVWRAGHCGQPGFRAKRARQAG